MKLGIICAMTVEAQTVHPKKLQPGDVLRLNDSVILTVSGIGRDRATQAAQTLIDSGVTALLSWGTATALSPQLRQGNLLIPVSTISSGGQTFSSNSQWVEAILHHLADMPAPECGNLAEADSVLSSTEEKQAMMRSTGAIAADMESAAIAGFAESHGMPFLVIRAISDTADMCIPQAIATSVDAAGHLPVGKILTEILLKPSGWSNIARLAVGMRKSASTLTEVRQSLNAVFALPHS